jgi:hypothetical protein
MSHSKSKTPFKKKSDTFILKKKKLYLKSDPNLEAIPFDDKANMRNIVDDFHIKNNKHWGITKTAYYFNGQYHSIDRKVIRDVIVSCIACSQSQPLYIKDRMMHIFAKKPNERFQMDLVDLLRWKSENNSYAYILNVIDVYSKFCFAIPLQSKKMLEVSVEMDFFLNISSKSFWIFQYPSKSQKSQTRIIFL